MRARLRGPENAGKVKLNRVQILKPDGTIDQAATDKRQTEESGIIQQQVREALSQASQDVQGTLKQWTEEASAHQGRLLALQQDFDAKVKTLLSKLQTTGEDRELVLDERNAALQEQLESVRAQTGLSVERSRLSLRGKVFPAAKQLVADHIEAIGRQHPEASARVGAVRSRLESEFKFQEDATWQDISREAAEWLREAERAVGDSRPSGPAGTQEIASDKPLGQLQLAVAGSLEAGASASDGVATFMAAAEFEASFAHELNKMIRTEAESRVNLLIPKPKLLAEGAAQNMGTLFKAGSAWMEAKDHSTTPLPEASLLAIDRLRQVVAQIDAKESKSTDEKKRRDDAAVLINALTGLKRVADTARKIQSDTVLSEDALPYLRSLIDRELLPQLDQLAELLKSKGFNDIKVRGGGFFGSTPESKVIESIRQGLVADGAKVVDQMRREVIDLKGRLPGGPGLNRGQLDQQPAGTVSPERPDLGGAIEIFDFGDRASPIDDISLYLPEYRELCERVLKEPGGEAALFQVQQLLLRGLAGSETAHAVADARAILTALDERIAPAALSSAPIAAPKPANFGLQIQRTLGDGNCYFNAIAAQVGESQDDVRQRVAQDMKSFVGQVQRPKGIARSVDQIDVDRTLQDARYFGSNAWGEDYHCAHVARVYNRPVVLFGNGRAEIYRPNNEIENLQAGASLPRDAIFVVHNGGNHWEWAKPPAASGVPKLAGQAKVTVPAGKK